MIQVKCECGRAIRTNDENAGKKAKCPECGAILQLPGPKAAQATGQSPKPRAPETVTANKPSVRSVRKPKPSDDDEFEDLPVADYADDDDDDELPSPRRKKIGSAANRSDSNGAKSAKKKKAGSKAAAQTNNTMLIVGCVLGGVAFLAIGGGVIFMMSSKKPTTEIAANGVPAAPAAAQAIPELENFATAQSELTCLAPKGWETKFGGGSGGVPVFATFEKGKVKIQFRSSPSGTQIGAIAQAGMKDPKDLPESMRPLSVAHEYQKEKFSAEVSGYQEKGEPKMFKCSGFGQEGRISAFTASEGMFGQMYGYRATFLGNNNQWNVICKCPPGDWKACQPLFLKVLESASGN